MSTPLNLCLDIPFPNATQAGIAYNTLRVDKELPSTGVNKVLTVEDNKLKVKFTAPSAKSLRIAVNSFMVYTILVTETISRFGPPVAKNYSYFSP